MSIASFASDLTLLSDNTTCWNSTYLSIHRALKLRHQIMIFCTLNAKDLEQDTLSMQEWDQLEQIELILKPFQQATKHLEGNAVHGHHGSNWEALPAVELFLAKLETAKDTYKDKAISLRA
jgi:hypothetical protein